MRWLHGVVRTGPDSSSLSCERHSRYSKIGLTHYFMSKSVGGEDGIVRHYLSDSVASADKSRSALTLRQGVGGDKQVGSHIVSVRQPSSVGQFARWLASRSSLTNQESEDCLACRPEAHAMSANNRPRGTALHMRQPYCLAASISRDPGAPCAARLPDPRIRFAHSPGNCSRQPAI